MDAGPEYRIIIDVPGAVKDDVEVRSGPVRGTLALTARVREEPHGEGHTLIQERGSTRRSRYARILPVAWDADVDRAKVSLADGVLTILVPKTAGTTVSAASEKKRANS